MPTTQTLVSDETPEQPVKPAQTRRTLPLWRNVNYLLLMSGQAISSTGSQVSLVAFPLLVLALTHSPAETGFLTALRALPYAILCLPAGALVDRWNRRRIMVVSDVGRAMVLGSIPVALALGHLTFIQIALVSLIEGTLFVFYNMAEAAAMPHVVSPEQLSDAMSQSEVANSLSFVAGPALGPILYSIGSSLPFVTDAISYAASVISLLFIKVQFQDERHETAEVKQHNLLREIGEGIVWLWHNPLIRFVAILTAGLITPCTGYVLILVVQAQHMHASNATIGLIFASGGLGSVVGALIVGPLQKRFSFGQIIVSATWIWAISWLFYALAPNPFWLGAANLVSVIIVPIYMVTQYTYRTAVVPDQLLGRVNSVFRLIAFGGQPLGIALTGVLVQALGLAPAIIVLFIPQGVLAIAVTINKHVRHAPRV